MEKILYINACVRDGSRTKRIADYLLSKLDGEVEQVNLIDIDFPKTDQEFAFHWVVIKNLIISISYYQHVI